MLANAPNNPNLCLEFLHFLQSILQEADLTHCLIRVILFGLQVVLNSIPSCLLVEYAFAVKLKYFEVWLENYYLNQQFQGNLESVQMECIQLTSMNILKMRDVFEATMS